MAKYFESISTNGDVILIDDSFKCMQVIKVFDGNKATYKYEYNEDVYYLYTGNVDAKRVIWGVGLDELNGLGVVTLDWERINESQLRIRIWKGGKIDFNDQWTQRNDPLINKLKFYAFTDIQDFTKSSHLTGLEIYANNGRVLYSSSRKALSILKVFTNAKGYAKFTENTNLYNEQEYINSTVMWRTKGVLIYTGWDFFIDREAMCSCSGVGVKVDGKTATLHRCFMGTTSRNRRPGMYNALFYNTDGVVIGELV